MNYIKRIARVERIVLCFFIFGIAAFFSGVNRSNGQTTTPNPIAQYAFTDSFMGWEYQTYPDSQACTEVLLSKMTHTKGSYSLAMNMNLIAGDPNRSKGEALVNLLDNPLDGVTLPIDMTNHILSAWIFAPQGINARGSSSAPNGFQLFVKDKAGNTEYGTWDSQFLIGEWYQLRLAVSTTQPQGGFMAPGFNPTQIVTLGIKMGTGSGSRTTFSGLIYVDDVSW